MNTLLNFFPSKAGNDVISKVSVRLISRNGFHVAAVVYLEYDKFIGTWSATISDADNLDQRRITGLRELLETCEKIASIKLTPEEAARADWHEVLIEKVNNYTSMNESVS